VDERDPENNPRAQLIFSEQDGKAAGGEIEPSKSTYLGAKASVAGGERVGILNALQIHLDNPEITTLSDSLTAIQSVLNVAKGHPARSGIERSIGTLLRQRDARGLTTNAAWVKAHIGIPGNEAADRLVNETSRTGSGSLVVTGEDVRALARRRAAARTDRKSFGTQQITWGNRTLSPYTWCRTNKGLQLSWLHKIRKSQDNLCPECGQEKTGEHIAFNCPAHAEERRKLGDIRTWNDLSKPIWRGEGRDRYDAGGDFFLYCNYHLTRRH